MTGVAKRIGTAAVFLTLNIELFKSEADGDRRYETHGMTQLSVMPV